ncbi:MAG TPA: hypothetical protein VFQ35_24725 [Polyangiaceae bacterium]|nr:hypothetical protein [Polyangiaceae bacterium]
MQLEAPIECPSAAEVVAAVDALVQTTPAQPLEVGAQIQHDAEGFSLKVTLGAGERRVHGDTCEAVTQALVAIVALAIDPSVQLSPPSPEVGQARGEVVGEGGEVATQGSSTPTAALSATAVARDPLPTRQRPADTGRASGSTDVSRAPPAPRFGASLLGFGEQGLLPSPSLGVGALLRATLAPWSLELGGSWLRPRWAQVEQVAARKGGYISWVSAQANGCRALGPSAAACAGLELGQVGGEGEGVSNGTAGHALWLAGALSALGRLRLGAGFSLEGRVGAAFPLYRPEFSIEPYGALHRASWLSGRVSAGIGFH